MASVFRHASSQSLISSNLLSGTSDSLLADSIDAYMRQTGSAAAEDVVRSFFRSQVREVIGKARMI
jgi:hypothetical protein